MEWQVSLWGTCYWVLPFEAILLLGKLASKVRIRLNVVMSVKSDWVYSGKFETGRWWYTCKQTPGWIQNLDVQWGETMSVLMSLRGRGLWSTFYVYTG